MSTPTCTRLFNNSVYREFRGETFTTYPLEGIDLGVNFLFDKQSNSHKNVLRGFHGDFVTDKLVRCSYGGIILVCMSIDPAHENYLKPECYMLDDFSCQSVFIPKGYVNAHYCLTQKCHFCYKISSPYDLDSQISIRWDSVGFPWGVTDPILSKRDETAPTLQEYLEKVNGR